MRIPVAPNVALHARQWPGENTPFLLVHGLASNARMWDGVAELLAAAGHRVVTVDLRGHGLSDKPDDGYDFETISNDLGALIAELNLGKVVAAGQSWGAPVVMHLALLHADKVSGVVCVDGGAWDMQDRLPDWDEAERVLAPPEFAGTTYAQVEAYGRRVHADWPETGIQGMLANFQRHDDGTVTPWLRRDLHMKIVRYLWEHRSSETAKQLTVPVVFILARDHDAHHDIHAQKPDLVARLMLEAFVA